MTTAMVDRPLDDPSLVARDEQREFAIEIVPGFEAIAHAWRALETEAVMTPYGRLDWVEAYQQSRHKAERDTRVAVLRERGGAIVLLQPFQIERRGPLRVAAAIGGKHANYNLPVIRRDVAHRLSPERAHRILTEAGRSLGVDLVSIPNVPITWNGWPNPFAVGGQASASDAWALRLLPDGEAALARSMSGEARKKMRNKARALAKRTPVAILRAETPADVDRVLEAYFRQKSDRFAALGISDPFGDDAVRAFFRAASNTGGPGNRPAIELYALQAGEEILAVLGGASDGHRFSGMIVSFRAGPLDKYSLGEMLVTAVVRDLGARGFGVFDLGVGDARYKRSICEEVEPLVDLAVPLTWRGHGVALAQSAVLGAKRRVKADPHAMALVSRLRKLKVGLNL